MCWFSTSPAAGYTPSAPGQRSGPGGDDGAGKKLDREPVTRPRCPIRFASPIFSKVIFWLFCASENSNSEGFDGEIEHLLMVVIAQFNDALLQAATSLCGRRHHVLHGQHHFLGDLLADLVECRPPLVTMMLSASFVQSDLMTEAAGEDDPPLRMARCRDGGGHLCAAVAPSSAARLLASCTLSLLGRIRVPRGRSISSALAHPPRWGRRASCWCLLR